MDNQFKVVSGYKGMLEYIKAVRASDEPDFSSLWHKYVIDPYWDEWASGKSVEERIREQMKKPETDICKLEKAVNLLASYNIEGLLEKLYENITQLLPPPEPGKIVCVYTDIGLDESIHGVVGSCIDDNILIQVNPLVEGWQDYIPWAFAHEYNHNVWGYNYYYLKANTSQDLLTSMIVEGEADSFAKAICPDLSPLWTRALSSDEESKQWGIIKEYLRQGDNMELHCRFFFGDNDTNTPPSVGYTIGFNIVQAYLKAHPEVTFVDLANKDVNEILTESGYK